MRLRSSRLTALSRGTRNPVWTPAQLGSSLALWLDADDASTITLNGSTVSEWRDKSGNGRHATQATAANQPAWGRGRNLLLWSEDLSNSVWLIAVPSNASNVAIAPDGTKTADVINATNTAITFYQTVTVTPNTTYTFSFYVRLGTLPVSDFKFAVRDDSAGQFIGTDLVPSAAPTSSNWTRVVYTFTTPASCTLARVYPVRNGSPVTGSVFLWGTQLNPGITADPYTRTEAVAQTLRSGINGRATLAWPDSLNNRFLRTADSFPTRDVFIVAQYQDGTQSSFLGAYQGLFGGGGSGSYIGLIGDLPDKWYTFCDFNQLRRNGGSQQAASTSLTALPMPAAILNSSRTAGAVTAALCLGNDRELQLNRGWSGMVGEVIVLPELASEEIRQRIEGYLAWKWSGLL